MNHFLIDFETLGNNLTGKVTFVAYTHFDINDVESFDEIKSRTVATKLDWTADDQSSWDVDPKVMEFWKKQDQKVVSDMIGDPKSGITVSEFAVEFRKYMVDNGFDSYNSVLWSRGTSFDFTILDRIHYMCYGEPQYPFWRVRDTRTWLDAVNVALGLSKRGTPFVGRILDIEQNYNAHDAADDVAKDVVQIQMVYNTLSGCAAHE